MTITQDSVEGSAHGTLLAPIPWASRVPLIALGYRAGAGKDTVAQYLVDRHGFLQFSFAEPLKVAAMNLCGFSYAQVHGDQATKEAVDPRWGFSPRFFMQKFGTEVVRSIDRQFWVKVMHQSLRELEAVIGEPDGPKGVVISDMRFPNELAAVRMWGGFAVEVRREERWTSPIVRPPAPLTAEHVSESSLAGAGFDHTILNDGTLDELFAWARSMLATVDQRVQCRGRGHRDPHGIGYQLDTAPPRCGFCGEVLQ